MAKNYVMHSTEKSRESRTVSILAIIETVFFVFLTWFIAVYYDYYTHIYTAIAIAPFLLLKTPKSTQKAIELFLHEYKFDEKHFYKESIFWIALAISALLSFAISYFLLPQWLADYLGWQQFFMSMVTTMIIATIAREVIASGLGINTNIALELGSLMTEVGAMAITVANFINGIGVYAVAGAGTLTILVLTIFLIELGQILQKSSNSGSKVAATTAGALLGLISAGGIGFLLRSIFVKFIVTTICTLRHPIKTFFHMPKNFRNQIVINDLFYTPELLPDIRKKDSFFGLSSIIKNADDLSGKIVAFFIVPIWSLGYLYRFSIKSTAWFFFPFAYLSNLEALQSRNRQKKILALQTFKNYWIFNLFILAIVLIYFNIISKIPMPKQINWIFEYSNQISLFLHEHIVDGSIWLIVVSLILYLMINLVLSAKKHFESNHIDNPSVIPDKLAHWMIRLSFILWMVFLGWNLVVITNHELMPKVAELISP